MGYVTVIIQHGWKMENSRVQKNGNPNSYEIDRQARLGRPISPDHIDKLA